jgi:erythromycin esterase-like protein
MPHIYVKRAARSIDEELFRAARSFAVPLSKDPQSYDPLLELVGDKRFVLLGEASHGTHEFYRERAEITKRLIIERGFNAVAVEADWPDAYRINRYTRGKTEDATAMDSLEDFKRFPTWMWRNADVLDFIGWLRAHNSEREVQTGFYGLDLYSLHSSMAAVLRYLDKVDPEAAKEARLRYACFDTSRGDPQSYGLSASQSHAFSCKGEVLQQLLDLQSKRAEYLGKHRNDGSDEYFFAEQNARLAINAEEYYRTMYEGRVSSWNLRDEHMAETLEALVRHLQQRDGHAKVVVWAHNSHLGDARATQLGERGELNLGQLVREEHARESLNIGFSTYSGTVTAAADWDGPAEFKRVRPGMEGSYETILHQVDHPRFMLLFQGNRDLYQTFTQPRLERAIGVIYRPDTERYSHYFNAWLSRQFDVMIHFDQTRAVEPLERNAQWEAHATADTYPSGL